MKIERDAHDRLSVTKGLRMRWLRLKIMSRLRLPLILWGGLVLLSACSAVPEQGGGIQVGKTTREEVVERYGQPDLVRAHEDGEIAIYRPRDPNRPPPRLEIPTAQAGPLGTVTTKMEPVNPGLGTGPTNADRQKRPEQELRIRYDAQGIVQELIR